MRFVKEKNGGTFFYLIIAPAVLFMLWLTVYPVLNVIYLSLFDYDFFSGAKKFIAFGNYVKVIGDKLFQRALLNTLVFSVSATIAEVALGTLLAFIFYRQFKGKKLFMTIVIFPMMLSTMVVCAVWRILYHYDIGLLNYLTTSAGFAPFGWLINKNMAMFSIILVDIWQWTPFAFIIMNAAMGSIPSEIFEAAQIDGAGSIMTALKITIPILSSQIFLVMMLRTIDTFKLFGKVIALTGGGPGNSTETVSTYIYREGFSYFNMGNATAASLIVLLVIAAFSVIYIRKIFQED